MGRRRKKTKIFTQVSWFIKDWDTLERDVHTMEVKAYDEKDREKYVVIKDHWCPKYNSEAVREWREQFLAIPIVQEKIDDLDDGGFLLEFFIYYTMRELCRENKWEGVLYLTYQNQDFRIWEWDADPEAFSLLYAINSAKPVKVVKRIKGGSKKGGKK